MDTICHSQFKPFIPTGYTSDIIKVILILGTVNPEKCDRCAEPTASCNSNYPNLGYFFQSFHKNVRTLLQNK